MNVNKPDLEKLNSHVFLSKPNEEDYDAVQKAKCPSLILLFTWMDAQLPHIQKYIDALRDTFPASDIALIRSDSGFYWTSPKARAKLLEPVVHILESYNTSDNISNGVLIHVVSNGGGFQLVTLRKMLSKTPIPRNASLTHQIPTALVLDSTPGANGLESALAGMTPSNPLLYLLAAPPVALLYGLFHLINALGGNYPVFDELRYTLNNKPDLLPPFTSSVPGTGSDATLEKTTPRLYIYSKTDKATLARHVDRHVEEAVRMGFNTEVVKLQKSPHVTHARTDPERYWAAVKRLWTKTVVNTARL